MFITEIKLEPQQLRSHRLMDFLSLSIQEKVNIANVMENILPQDGSLDLFYTLMDRYTTQAMDTQLLLQ